MSTEIADIPKRTRPAACVDRAVAPQLQPARSYPLSRWYLRPAATWLAVGLTPTRVRPVHLTVCGLAAAAAATAVLAWRPEAMPAAAVLVLLYWFFDRADGQLARHQRSVSAWGAWLDGNVDELVDVALHVAVAAVVAARGAAPWPWWLLIAFLSGKYLLMYGLSLEEHAKRGHSCSAQDISFCNGVAGVERSEPPENDRLGAHFVRPQPPRIDVSCRAGLSTISPADDLQHRTAAVERAERPLLFRLIRGAYHLPGNADVRMHLLVAALATGCLAAELVLVAAYYNLRWLVRYVLVARRLGGAR